MVEHQLMKNNKKYIICPTCKKKTTWTSQNIYRPFCSKRCKLIDLGDWADEKFKIEGESHDKNNQKNDSNENKD